MALPYENASSGTKAREQIIKILRRFGCESVGFMDRFETRTVVLAFEWRGRQVQLQASAQGWSNAYLKENPWSDRRRHTEHQYEQRALDQGMIAVNSILRDWVKGQVTAIETGILTFDHVFATHMLLPDGTTGIEHLRKTLLLEDQSDVH